MSSTGGLFSQTLQEITNTKLDELNKKRNDFEEQRKRLLTIASDGQDPIAKLNDLSHGMKDCFSIPIQDGRVVRGATTNPRLEIDLKNLDRFLAQSRYDPSVSSDVVDRWQKSLFRHMDVQSLKYSYAKLYGQLTTEWLSSDRSAKSNVGEGDTEMEDYEEISSGKKMESRLEWEHSVFEPIAVNQNAITKMLSALFEATPEDSKHLVKALQKIREKTAAFEQEMASHQCFDASSLQWTIDGLLASDLLTDEKRAVLRDFRTNNVILKEVADVLNMRLADLNTWSWGGVVKLEQRRQLNGNFNIYMHEDLLHAIFLQYIGVRWSVFWKQTFSYFRQFRGVWKTARTAIPATDKKYRDFYLGPTTNGRSVLAKKQSIYRQDYFLAQLHGSVTQQIVVEEGAEEADFAESQTQTSRGAGGRTKQTARGGLGRGGAKRHRRILTDEERGIDADLDPEMDDMPDDSSPKNLMEAKQNLLHMLTTDILMKCRFDGEITCFRSQLDNLLPSLPHRAIESVLAYFGVSQRWLSFFTKFLQAPLQFVDDNNTDFRVRKQGTPGSHVLSEVFSEVILFCLDFKINQTTNGEIFWRVHDSAWFWSSSQELCYKAWSTMKDFVNVMGLAIDENKSGSARIVRDMQAPSGLASGATEDILPKGAIRWGMLILNPASGRFEIDQQMVGDHVSELSRQLGGKSGSIFAWIQTWNTYASTFFTHNFGKPSQCFGRQHVDNMLATHEYIQREVFSVPETTRDPDIKAVGNGSVLEYLKHVIRERFEIDNIPDGYFLFPTELGGLELHSPFIGLLQLRDEVLENPAGLLDDFEEQEKDAYKKAKASYEDEELEHIREHTDDPKYLPPDPEKFISFEEFTKYREELSYAAGHPLVETFNRLLDRPKEAGVECYDNGEVMAAINALGTQYNLRGISSDWYSMDPYWKWVAQLYGPEIIQKFAGFNIVDPGLLPMGMVGLFRSGRVKWEE